MPPPVVAFTSPAASPTASTRFVNVRGIGASGSIFNRGAWLPEPAVRQSPTVAPGVARTD